MKQSLIISLLGKANPKLLPTLSRAIVKHKCSITKSRMLTMGDKEGLQLQIDGSWNEFVKLELEFKKIANHLQFQLIMERSDEINVTNDLVPYVIELNAPENTLAVEAISQFLSEQGIIIYEMNSSIYMANPIKLPMSNLQMRILISNKLSLPDLRENFVGLCDALNIDAYLDPERG